MNTLFTRRLTFSLLLAFLFTKFTFAQNQFFQIIKPETARDQYKVKPSIPEYTLLRIDDAALRQYLADAPMEFEHEGPGLLLEVPLPNGETEIFSFEESPILAPQIAAEHPNIKTYSGQGTRHKERIMRLSLTSLGFGGIILNVNKDAVRFESYERGSDVYVAYFAGKVQGPDRKPLYHCGVDDPSIEHFGVRPNNQEVDYRNNTGATLRRYDLAIAADAYFTNHPDYGNGSVSTAFNWIADFVNNMVAVYRVEMCVSFTLVSGTNVIYTNPLTDPYTDDDQGANMTENHDNLDAVIGSGNYDVGHVFGYVGGSGGGIASLESVCYSFEKGRGVSGMCDLNYYPQVYNDQLVYHEMGHQFGMNHSYNSSIPVCTTRNPGTSVEPGAGATIMSYGFTCGTDDYESTYGPILQFHTVNYAEAYAYFTNTASGYGGSCPTNTSTGNSLPVLTLPSNYTIPKSTPFMLTGSATDANGDGLSYCWEGTNVGTSTPNSSTLDDTSKPPFFRSYAPENDGTRYYPRLETILDQTYQGKGDKMPSIGVTTTHRLTVRDNRSTGGATVYGNVTVTVSGTIGPFYVFNFASNSTYAPNSSVSVTWNVGGTTGSPVSCSNVDILFSADGGATFPYTLTANTPNDGAQTVTMPNLNTTTARIMVKCSNNIFFDITNQFKVQGALSVEWLEFQATTKNKHNAWLYWQTARETNNKGFEVEMATGATTNFQTLGFVPAETDRTYDFNVPGLTAGTYYFRLKQMDIDGKETYSPIRSLVIGDEPASFQLSPNPASAELNVRRPAGGKEVNMQIINQIGQIVGTTTMSENQELLTVNIRDLPAGVYVLICQTGGATENVRFTKE